MAKGGQGPKLAIAVVFFLIAGAAIAWQMGVFGGGSPTQKTQAERDADAERIRKAVEAGEMEQPKALLE